MENYHLWFSEIQKRDLPFFGENTIGTEGGSKDGAEGERKR